MPLERYAMIIKSKKFNALPQTITMGFPGFSTTVVFVQDMPQAFAEAHQLVAQGIQLIELCGGFSLAEKDQLVAHIQDEVPVGVVQYNPEEMARLERQFG